MDDPRATSIAKAVGIEPRWMDMENQRGKTVQGKEKLAKIVSELLGRDVAPEEIYFKSMGKGMEDSPGAYVLCFASKKNGPRAFQEIYLGVALGNENEIAVGKPFEISGGSHIGTPCFFYYGRDGKYIGRLPKSEVLKE